MSVEIAATERTLNADLAHLETVQIRAGDTARAAGESIQLTAGGRAANFGLGLRRLHKTKSARTEGGRESHTVN